MKSKTLLANAGSAPQPVNENMDPRRRDAVPRARRDSKQRPLAKRGDPAEFNTRMPPAARQETPGDASRRASSGGLANPRLR